VPTADGIDTTGLDLSPETLARSCAVDNEAWRGEIPLIEEHFGFIGERLPAELADELRELEKRLAN
jgi:phosphoenolpyruvate carboxykinase (GTP)